MKNYEEKMKFAIGMYKTCPLTGNPYSECNTIDFHHQYPKYKCDKITSKKNIQRIESDRFYEVVGLFRDCLFNVIPVDHVAHINGVGKLKYTDEEFNKFIRLFCDNKEYDHLLNDNCLTMYPADVLMDIITDLKNKILGA